jgi:hypothetical protein
MKKLLTVFFIISGYSATAQVGSATILQGNATQAGYIEWRKPGGVRQAYMGWDPTVLNLNLEAGHNFNITGGRLGIGMATPQAPLDIAFQSNTTSPHLNLRRSGAGDVGISFQQNGVTAFGIVNKSGGGLAFVDNYYNGSTGATKMFIKNATGEVGIGTTSPQYPLHVMGRISSDQGNDGGIWCAPNRFVGAGNDFVGLYNGGWNLILKPGGNVQVNTGGLSVGVDGFSPGDIRVANRVLTNNSLIIGDKFSLARSSRFNGGAVFTDEYLRLTNIPDAGGNCSYLKFAASDIWSGGSLIVASLPSATTVNRFKFYPSANDRIVLQNMLTGQTNLEVKSNVASAMGQIIFTSPNGADAEAVIGSGPTLNSFGVRFKQSNGVMRDMIHITSENELFLLDNNATGDKVKVRGEICVTASGTCDYVFKDDYKLRSIENLEQFIKQNGHLPGVKNDAEVKAAGEVNLLEQSNALLEKTEEFALYIIELKKQLDKQQKIDAEMKQRLDKQELMLQQVQKNR